MVTAAVQTQLVLFAPVELMQKRLVPAPVVAEAQVAAGVQVGAG